MAAFRFLPASLGKASAAAAAADPAEEGAAEVISMSATFLFLLLRRLLSLPIAVGTVSR